MAEGLLLSVTDPLGRQLQFTYGPNGHIASMIDPGGGVTTYGYTYGPGATLVSRTDPNQKTRTYIFNEPAYTKNTEQYFALTGIQDENNRRYATFGYSSNGQAISTQHAGGADAITLSYVGSITTATDGLGVVRTYFSTTQFNVTKPGIVSRPCASCIGGAVQSSRAYDANGYPYQDIDFDGVMTEHAYGAVDAEGHVRGLETQRIEVQASVGTGTPAEKRTVQTDWHPTFRVPTERRTLNASNALEAKTQWAYNTRGQATARCEIDPADTAAMSYTCSASSAPPTGAKVRRTVTTYCEQSDVTAGTCPLVGLVTSVNGPRATSDAGMGGIDDVTTYTYYQTDDPTCATGGACPHRHGDLWKVTNALGQVTETVSYDKNGRVTRSKDANGTLTDFAYHPRGWLTDRIVRVNANGAPSANDATLHIDYDAVGNVVKVTQPDGDYLAYTYDDAHRLIKIADNLNDTIDYCPGGVGSAECLDAAGNRKVEQVKDASGTIKRQLHRVYNQLGQLTQQLNAANDPVETSAGLSESLTGQPAVADGYDGNGNRVLSDDGLGTRTKQQYDGLNRLVATIQNYGGTDTATANTTTQYTYDARDNLRQATDPDNVNTVYDYDGLNNLTGLHSPDTGNASYTYDAAGNRITQTDARGVTSTYTYDSLNRLTGIAYPTSSLNVSYAYDQPDVTTGCSASYSLGRLTRMTDSTGTTTYCYDLRGNVTKKMQVTNGVTLTTQYSYTQGNRLTSITYPSGGITTYTRDTLGRVKTITWKANASATPTTLVSNATYYPFGPLNVLTYGDGHTLTKTYDQDYAIDAVGSSLTDGLQLDLDVDVMGNIVSAVKPSGQASRVVLPNYPNTYVYDPLYRLTDVIPGGLVVGTLESYTYNATGDRLGVTLNGGHTQVYTYEDGSHHLTAIGSTARTYDANGNTLTGAGATLTYDNRNRLSQSVGLNGTALYGYNGRGERVSKSQSGLEASSLWVPAIYAYGESGQLLGDYTSAVAVQTEYIYLDSTPIAAIRGGQPYYVETDHLSTPRALVKPGATSASDVTVWTWNLLGNTFGADAPDEDPDGDNVAFQFNLRYPGQYADAEMGFNYNRFRYFESATGRYLESDPIGLGGGFNTYSYVDSDPLEFADPKGLKKWDPNYWHKDYDYFSNRTNCYGYARDSFDDSDPDHAWFLFLYMTCDRIRNAAMRDGLIPANEPGDCGGSCPPGYYKVQVFMTSEPWTSHDYHFVRQDDDGGWSHKQGRFSSPRRDDSNGALLTCPMNQPLNFPPRNYNKYCGTLCNKN